MDQKTLDFVICCGMQRSASTWQYQIASELVETFLDGKRLGFIHHSDFNANNYSSDSIPLVFKTHDFHSKFDDLLQTKSAKAIYSFRDLREVFCSLMWKYNLTFDELIDHEIVHSVIDNHFLWKSRTNILIQNYDSIISNPEKAICQIADFLGIELNNQKAETIAAKYSKEQNQLRTAALKENLTKKSIDLTDRKNLHLYDKTTLLHWNHFRPQEKNCWQSCLDRGQIERLWDRAKSFLIDTCSNIHVSPNWENFINEGNQFISFAQNYEDLMLWRALGHIGEGFYVDVGAYDPTIASVTKAFYDRGWHGINIEPISEMVTKLSEARPRDVNINAAASDRNGERDFYRFTEGGFSTLEMDVADNLNVIGIYNLERVKTRTLNSILEEFGQTPIHFIKIDVEGHEKKVLNGLDLNRWEPWIIVIESTDPNSPMPNFEKWEPLILSAEYHFTYFDGLNRFYISNKHRELDNAFHAPPNVFDDFITADYYQTLTSLHEKAALLHSMEEKYQRLEEEMKNAVINIQRLKVESQNITSINDELRGELQSLISKIELLDIAYEHEVKQKEDLTLQYQQQIEALNMSLEQTQSRLHQSEENAHYHFQKHSDVVSSRSWKITQPLRRIAWFFRQAKGKIGAITFNTILFQIIHWVRFLPVIRDIADKVKYSDLQKWNELRSKIRPGKTAANTTITESTTGNDQISDDVQYYQELLTAKVNDFISNDRKDL